MNNSEIKKYLNVFDIAWELEPANENTRAPIENEDYASATGNI